MLVDIKNVKTVTVAEIAEITGYTEDFYKNDFVKSGVYRVLSGSRGIIEEVEFIQDLDNQVLKLMDKQECLDTWDYYDDEEKQDMIEYVNEFYGYELLENYLQFGYTEEEFDYYFKVVV